MSNVLGKLWRGQYPLWVMFWGFYVAGYLVSFGLMVLVAPQFNTQPWRFLSVLILLVPYNVVSTVGVLRSVAAYPRGYWWAILTGIVVCLWEARLIWSLSRGTWTGLTEWAAN